MRPVTLRPPDCRGQRVQVQMEQKTPAHRQEVETVLRDAERVCRSILFLLCESLNYGARAPSTRGNKAECDCV